MMRCLRTCVPALAIVALLFGLGCTTEEHSEHDHDHEHEHEHTHEHEHREIAHKPADYPKAVRRLRELHEQLAAEEKIDSKLDPWDEYLDLVRWLPELAADSDLAKEPWDNIHQTSKGLEQSLKPILASAHPESAYSEAVAEIEPLLNELDRAVRLFPTESKPPVSSETKTSEEE